MPGGQHRHSVLPLASPCSRGRVRPIARLSFALASARRTESRVRHDGQAFTRDRLSARLAPAQRAVRDALPGFLDSVTQRALCRERVSSFVERSLLDGCVLARQSGDGVEVALELTRTGKGPIESSLSDIVLPDASRSELATLMSAQCPALHVLFMSADPADILVQQGRVPAGTPTIGKPFDEHVLPSPCASRWRRSNRFRQPLMPSGARPASTRRRSQVPRT